MRRRPRGRAGWLAVAILSAAAVLAAPQRTLLVVGDSLSSGYGLPAGAGWVDLLAGRLADQVPPYRVVNASVSGDTTLGGRSRIEADLAAHRPSVVVLELGGNDGLRGIPPAETERNLAAMAAAARAAGARVLILGIRLPPNLGPAYTERFFSIYRRVADRHGAARVPFFLDGVGGVPSLMQADGLHPTTEAQSRLLDNVWPHLEPLL